MRLLLDNQLPPSLARHLGEAGHDVLHVGSLGMHAAEDHEIVALAAEQDRVVVTADADFGTLLALRREVRPSVVFVRGVTPRTPNRLAPLLLSALSAASEALASGAIVVVEDARIRVRRLPIGGES